MQSLIIITIDDLEEFPDAHRVTDDIDTFAEDTGYEGTFANQDFLFPVVDHHNQEQYDYFDPYEEDEWIITGSMMPKNIYGASYDQNSDSEDFLGNSRSTFEQSESKIEAFRDQESPDKAKQSSTNGFRPYDDGEEMIDTKNKSRKSVSVITFLFMNNDLIVII